MRPGLGSIALFAVAASACVSDYGGAKIELTIKGAVATGPQQHIEVWARDGERGIVRIIPAVSAAYAIVPAVDYSDPCLINKSTGGLLWKPEGHEGTEEQKKLAADAVSKRMDALIKQRSPMLAFVSWDDKAASARPKLAVDAPPGERLTACNKYWSESVAYTGNPMQITDPLAGDFYGAIDFASFVPPQVYGGIEIRTDWGLRDLQELWITQTGATIAKVDVDQVDCAASPSTCRGAVILHGKADPEYARGVFHVEMRTPWSPTPLPQPSLEGAATVYTSLDQDPVQF